MTCAALIAGVLLWAAYPRLRHARPIVADLCLAGSFACLVLAGVAEGWS